MSEAMKPETKNFSHQLKNMNKTQASQFIDVVSGTIIGDETVEYRGGIYYEGRQQHRDIFAPSEPELRKLASETVEKILTANNNAQTHIWPDRSKWELRIYNN